MLYTNQYVDKKEFEKSHSDFCFTQDQIINELHFDKGVMTRTMKSLEEKGIVKRNKNPDDSRSFIFSLTDYGILIKKEIIEVLKEWTDGVFKDIDDIDKVNLAITKMSINAKKLFEGE